MSRKIIDKESAKKIIKELSEKLNLDFQDDLSCALDSLNATLDEKNKLLERVIGATILANNFLLKKEQSRFDLR